MPAQRRSPSPTAPPSALMLTSGIAVLLGEALARAIPPVWLQ
jgi:hypothetical protein